VWWYIPRRFHRIKPADFIYIRLGYFTYAALVAALKPVDVANYQVFCQTRSRSGDVFLVQG